MANELIMVIHSSTRTAYSIIMELALNGYRIAMIDPDEEVMELMRFEIENLGTVAYGTLKSPDEGILKTMEETMSKIGTPDYLIAFSNIEFSYTILKQTAFEELIEKISLSHSEGDEPVQAIIAKISRGLQPTRSFLVKELTNSRILDKIKELSKKRK